MNNYDDNDIAHLNSLETNAEVIYLIYGKEIGDGGTPHLQGFVHFAGRKRLISVKRIVGVRSHCERTRGTPYQAAEYCRKDGDFVEFGAAPVNRPTRTGSAGLFAAYVTWVSDFYSEHSRRPNEREIAREFPHLFVRYSRALGDLTEHLCPPPEIQDGELRDWQIDLNNLLHEEPDDRTVTFVVDPEGGKGKTFFYRWFFTNNPFQTQLLSVAKRDDVAHAIDPSKSIFLFNVPRRGMEFLQYTVLEQIKDRVVFSPKYNSTTKVFENKTHVVVFCNEHPDMGKMSADRFIIINI